MRLVRTTAILVTVMTAAFLLGSIPPAQSAPTADGTLNNPSFEGGNTSGVGTGWTGYQRTPNPTTAWSIQTASPPTGGGLQYQQIANTSATGGGGTREIRWLEEHGRVIADGAGEPVRMQGVVFSVADRKQMEEALRATLAEPYVRKAALEGRDLRCYVDNGAEGAPLLMQLLGRRSPDPRRC